MNETLCKTRMRRVIAAIVFTLVCLAVGHKEMPLAAVTSTGYALKEGQTRVLQLDGEGGKERIRYELSVEKTEDASSRNDYCNKYSNVLTLYVNNKVVYTKGYEVATRANESEVRRTCGVYIGQIDKKNTVMDIFIGTCNNAYTSPYLSLDYCRYEKGKLNVVQDLKKLTDKLFSKALTYEIDFHYFHSMYFINDSLEANGNNELWLTIDLPVGKGAAEIHGKYPLKLKNGKLVKKSNAVSGKVEDFFELTEECKFYTTPGGNKVSFVAGKSGEWQMLQIKEYKIIGNEVYYLATNNEKKTGWINSKKLVGGTGNHM